MDYNTDREHLILPEYGRNVQNMVDYAVTIPDRAERQRCAETIVKVMGMIQPEQLNSPDGERVLWDHLARMSHYKLDIDYPVPITPAEELEAKPDPVPYPMTKIKMRHYGHLLEELMHKLGEMTDGPERDRLIELTANQMRKDLFYWNKDAFNEAKIAKDLALYTDGHVQIDDSQLHFKGNVPNGNSPKNPIRKGRARK